ncbi:MAG TPA: YraN family protein [Candidatus Eremiobacteraeota bacterium]|nr:YraN family protein [Candidatus Eremiobacteraeota bacterium]
MKLSRKQLGHIGEKEALKLLLNKGYKLIEKNFRCPLGEVDLIMKEGDELVFIEVRSRTCRAFGEAFETVNLKKQNKLYKLGEYYLQFNGLEDVLCRFDVVSLLLTPGGEIKEGEHIENAFGM